MGKKVGEDYLSPFRVLLKSRDTMREIDRRGAKGSIVRAQRRERRLTSHPSNFSFHGVHRGASCPGRYSIIISRRRAGIYMHLGFQPRILGPCSTPLMYPRDIVTTLL